MFEHHKAPLASPSEYLLRIARVTGIGLALIAGSLSIGAVGYHWIEDLGWLDAYYNAAMILTGMGPVTPMRTDAGKLFATGYAIFSGVAFLTTVAVLLSPMVHRFLHRFHLEAEEDEKPKRKN